MKQPPAPILWAVSLIAGILFAYFFLWVFGIEVSNLERFRNFPDGWSFMELAFNAFGLMFLLGATRAVYKGLREYYNPSDDDAPPHGGY